MVSCARNNACGSTGRCSSAPLPRPAHGACARSPVRCRGLPRRQKRTLCLLGVPGRLSTRAQAPERRAPPRPARARQALSCSPRLWRRSRVPPLPLAPRPIRTGGAGWRGWRCTERRPRALQLRPWGAPGSAPARLPVGDGAALPAGPRAAGPGSAPPRPVCFSGSPFLRSRGAAAASLLAPSPAPPPPLAAPLRGLLVPALPRGGLGRGDPVPPWWLLSGGQGVGTSGLQFPHLCTGPRDWDPLGETLGFCW